MSRIEQQDLVLQPSSNVDPEKWDESKYYNFVDELCQGREYQKIAIFKALRFLLSGNYRNLEELARKNYDTNTKLHEYYHSWQNMKRTLQFPDILSCSLDLATGTGKSYVLYGLATIMLAEKAVNRVLLLCPSLTIERGLTDKFRQLATDDNLRDAMPEDAAYTAPGIIDAAETVKEGDVCIENYHAVLEHVKSSIHDSFVGVGGDALVLNDEAHHVAAESSAKRGKWKEFLMNPEYGFCRIIGVSGTCYVGNEYFTDVVSRYSLRQAIEEKIVKNVEYVSDAPITHDSNEQWQLIYQNHKNNSKTLKKRDIRPLSIIVTNQIGGCDIVAEELKEFLQTEEKINEEQAADKILVVTSSDKHKRNIPQLQNVDNSQSKIEWVISVSMLSEGWDVKNVFQIVPHKERAFNSKLLIAQVLGRGLRIPENWKGEQPIVTVFNHQSWSTRIKDLVNEILEIEQRISSMIIPNSNFHFNLHNLDYKQTSYEKSYKMEGEYNLFESGIIHLPSAKAEEEGTIEYERVRGRGREQKLIIRHKHYDAQEIATHMWSHLRAVDEESNEKTKYSKKYSLEYIKEVVIDSVKKAGIDQDKIPDTTRQKLLAALNVVKRNFSKRVTYKNVSQNMLTISTRDRHHDSCSAAEIRRDKTIFYRSDCEKYIQPEQKEFFNQLIDRDGDFMGKAEITPNDFYFKSPVNLAIADHIPERKFIRKLCDKENADLILGWIKNTNMGFYTIQYAWGTGHRPGRTSHTKRGDFSPDFFIKIKNGYVLVIEIKDDNEAKEPSRENVGKYRAAIDHFNMLNAWLTKENESVRYKFNMLTPKDYDMFFSLLKDGHVEEYKSEIDAAIENIKEENGKK